MYLPNIYNCDCFIGVGCVPVDYSGQNLQKAAEQQFFAFSKLLTVDQHGEEQIERLQPSKLFLLSHDGSTLSQQLPNAETDLNRLVFTFLNDVLDRKIKNLPILRQSLEKPQRWINWLQDTVHPINRFAAVENMNQPSYFGSC